MSLLGQTRSFDDASVMSRFPPKAETDRAIYENTPQELGSLRVPSDLLPYADSNRPASRAPTSMMDTFPNGGAWS
jgi:hypothetical protein